MNNPVQSIATALAALLFAGSVWAQTAAAPAPVAPPAATAAPQADAGQGKVAWYGRKFAGRKTANGERFNPGALASPPPRAKKKS